MSFEIKIKSNSEDEVFHDALLAVIERTVQDFYKRNPNSNAVVTSKVTKEAPEVKDPPVLNHMYTSRKEAEVVADYMRNLVDDQGYARIADLKSMICIIPEFQDGSFGWRDLNHLTISRFREGGYLINFPTPVKL